MEGGKRGNSGFVARKLTQALSSFLEVDESMVESRLLNPKKSRISLNNVRLKPRIIREDHDCAIEITGGIESVVFKWKWNYFQNSKTYKGLMKRTALILKGVTIVMKPISGTDAAVMEARNRLSQSSLNQSFKEENEAEKKQPKFIRNVMEQFSINIEDIEVHLELPTDPSDPLTLSKKTIVLSLKGINLEPIGLKKHGLKRKQKDPLLQELRVESIVAKVINFDENGKRTILPFIDPFQYSATAKRFHGERFSGFNMGLEVTGNAITNSIRRLSVIPILSAKDDERDGADTHTTSSSTTGEIEISVDNDEIETSLCGAMSVSWDLGIGDETRDPDRTAYDGIGNISAGDIVNVHLEDLQTVALFSAIKMFSGDSDIRFDVGDMNRRNFLNSVIRPGGFGALSKMSPRTYAKSTKELNKSSLFNFPFPSVTAILPNKTKVVARDCNFTMRTDGSRCVFEGGGGVTINDERLLEDGSSFIVDMINKDITLKPSNVPKSVGEEDFELNLKGVQNVAVGVGELVRLRSLVIPQPPTQAGQRPFREEAPDWSLKVQGTTEIKL